MNWITWSRGWRTFWPRPVPVRYPIGRRSSAPDRDARSRWKSWCWAFFRRDIYRLQIWVIVWCCAGVWVKILPCYYLHGLRKAWVIGLDTCASRIQLQQAHTVGSISGAPPSGSRLWLSAFAVYSQGWAAVTGLSSPDFSSFSLLFAEYYYFKLD